MLSASNGELSQKKYKSKKLKNLAWILARLRTRIEYEKAEADIFSLVKSALEWFQEVGPGKWSTAHSPCPRYNISTFNKVKAVNSAFKSIRSIPTIDCIIEIERNVASKGDENVSKVKR